jgi:hypothetical protein
MSKTCLTQAPCALHTCDLHAKHRQHTFHMHTFMNAQAYCTTCKNATSSMHLQRMHKRCMHGPHKKCSSCTYATYVTYTSMLQACQRHTLCAYCMQTACHTCMCACHTHTTYVAFTLLSYTQYIPILHACTLYPHMQATSCCMFTSCKTHVNTFHECTN